MSVRCTAPASTGLVMQAAMAAAMVGMLWPAATMPVRSIVWQMFFGAAAAGFLGLWLARRRRGLSTPEHRDHGVSAAAMLFMYTPASWSAPLAADALAVVFTACLVLMATRHAHTALVGARELASGRPGAVGVPRLVAPVGMRCCEAAMAGAMAGMMFSGMH